MNWEPFFEIIAVLAIIIGVLVCVAGLAMIIHCVVSIPSWIRWRIFARRIRDKARNFPRVDR